MSKITKKILSIILIVITFIFPFSTAKAKSCSQSTNFLAKTSGDHTVWSSDQVRAGSFGGSLTPTQSTALYTRMVAFTTAVQAMPAVDNTTLGYNYLWAAFSPGAQSLHILESNDGISWADENVSYTPSNAGGYVRDPTIAYFAAQGKFWIAHTNTTFGVANTSFNLGSSTNANIFSAVQQVDMSSLISGANAQVWAPEWIHNPDGSPWLDSNGLPHIIVSASNSGIQGTNFQFYETHPTNASDFSQPWSAPVLITGTSLSVNMIDAYPIVDGSTITFWYKDETTKYIGYMTGSTASLTSGYSITQSGNWAGWGQPHEGESIISTGGNNWRIYLDAQGDGYYYSDSTDNGATWSAKTLITAPYTVQHGTVINIASISASPSSIIQNSIGNVITLTGTNTLWTVGTPGTPTFTLSGGTGASLTAQSVIDSNHASITIFAGSVAETLTITDPSSNTTANIFVSTDKVYNYSTLIFNFFLYFLNNFFNCTVSVNSN